MRIEPTNYGKKVTIKNGDGEWSYELRCVRVLNGCYEPKVLHPSIDQLAQREYRIQRRLLRRIAELEEALVHANDDINWIAEWEETNKLDFNRYFHDVIRDTIDENDGISLQYVFNASDAGLPWCF